MRSTHCSRVLVALLALLSAVSLCPRPAAAQDTLGTARLQIAGTRLVAGPAQQTVPFDTATVVNTSLEGYDTSLGVLPAEMRVLGDFTGPEVEGILTLQTVPGEPFRIPRLRAQGDYRLENIRLVLGDEVLAYAEPRDAGILVTQILVTSVSSRALTLDEIRAYGLVIDENSFEAINLTFAYGVAGKTFDFNMPLVYDLFGPDVDLLPSPDTARLPRYDENLATVKKRFKVPRVVPFTVELVKPEPPEIPTGGCDPRSECRPELRVVKPLVGVLLFPTEVSLLHQFFSVVLQVQNGAPEGDPAVLKNLFAQIQLPPGLRLGETEPPTILGDPVAVKDPGPDGEVGTADDRNFLVAGARGDAEVLLEGVKHGTHVVDFDISGVLEGLPTGPQAVTGSAKGAVSVRDPRLQVHIAHPQTVRAHIEYSVYLTVSNVGTTPVNLIDLTLPSHAISGFTLVSSGVQSIEKLDPGESETVEFRVESLRTGRVVSSSLRVGSSIDPSFEWSIAVGDDGALSGDSLLLPTPTEALPAELMKQALALVGIGYSLAKAPPSIASGLPRLSEEAVNERIYRLGQVGRHLDYGEPVFDAMAVLSAEWLGVRDGDWAWDQLRRESKNGDKLSTEIAALLETESASVSSLFERYAETTHFLGLQAAMVSGAGLRLEVTSRTSGKKVARAALEPERLRDLPFADLYAFSGGEMAVMGQPEEGGYSAWLRSDGGGSGDLHVLVPDAAGELRVARFAGITLGAGGVARLDFAAQDTSFQLAVDADGDGLFEGTEAPIMDLLQRRPFQVLAAVQNDQVDSSGHVVDVLFSEDVDLLNLVPRDPARFVLPNNLSNGGLVPTEADLVTGILAGRETIENPFEGLNNPRVVKVIFDNPVSPLLTNTLTVSDLFNGRGEAIAPQDVVIETRSEQQGARVEGTIYGSSGQTLAGATVLLYEQDLAGTGNDVLCVEHVSAATTTDADGHYAFDWVRQTDCGDVFRIHVQDNQTAEFGGRRGRVRLVGQTQELDIALPGRGSVVGRVTYDDGSVPDELNVMVYNPEFQAGRLAHIGDNGSYDVEAVVVGQVTLAADDGQGNFAYATFEMPNAGAQVQQDVILLRRPETPPGVVRGVVKLAEDGAPVEGAYLALYIEGFFTGSVRSGPDGRFDFGLVPPGIAEIEVFTEASTNSGERASQLFFEVRSDHTEDVEVLVTDQRGTVEGRVYHRSLTGALTPVAGAVVWAEGTPFNAVTDANGFYRLEEVFAGSWTINAAILETAEQINEVVTITSAGGVVNRDLYFDEELPGGGLVGTVLDFDGSPVSGATIHLSGGYLSVRWHHEVQTDGDGRFVIEDLGVGTYGVHAFSGSGGGLAWADIRFPGETTHVTVRYMKGTIQGRTVAPVGEDGSISGVVSQIAFRKVEVYGPWGLVVIPPDFTYIETDPNGYFSIEALAGPYELHVFNAFHGSATARNQIDYHGQVVDHEFLFEPNGDIRGQVLDHDGITPVAGARVNLSGGSFADYDVHTDENGEYHFPLVPPGSYVVEAFHTEGVVYRQGAVSVIVRKPGEQVDGVVVELPIQGTLTGWVEDADGYPVPGAVVTLQEGSYPWRKIVQNADEEGNYAFENVFGGGPVTLYGEAPALGGLGSRAQAEVSFEAQDVLTVLTLEATGDVEGTILTPADGSTVPRASVELSRSGFFEDATSSLSDGTYAFHQLPLGWYRAVVFDPGSGRRGKSEWVELAAHRDVAVADVELESRGVVTGRFMDADVDSPLPGHVVELRNTRWFRVYATTDIDGYFQFGGVPEGDFGLTAQDSAKRRLARGEGLIDFEDEIVNVDLTLAPFSEVTGRVLNPAGAPEGLAENVNVRIVQERRVVAASFDNPFAFDGVEPFKSFEVLVTENGGLRQGKATGRISAIGQDLDFDITLQALGNVTVTVTDSFGNPVPGADVYVANRHAHGFESFRASTGEDHTVSFADIREGPVTARATHPNGLIRGSVSGDLTLDGENLVLAVVLQDTGTVRGRALLPDGVTPAAAAVVALEAGSRWLLTETDELGAFELSSIVMGNFFLVVQEAEGDGTIERRGALTSNGEVVDYGDLVLDDTDPVVLDIQPPLASRDLPLDTAVTLTFSEPMDAARLGNSVRLRTIAGWSVNVTYQWSADQTQLTMTPTSNLASGTGYDIFVDQRVYDLAGRDLGWRVRSHFYTADVIPPSVLRSDPRSGAVQVPVDANLLVTFSEPVDLESLSGAAIQLYDVTAGQGLTTTFQLRPGDREVIVTPVAAMNLDSDIRLTVQGVRDLAGNVMAAPAVITFWTPDTTLPTGSFTAPAEGAVFTSGDTIAMAVDAQDNRTMGSVEFRIGEWSTTDASLPYTGSLLAPVMAVAGDVTLEATVEDAFGNAIELTRTVTVEPHANASAPTVETHCWYDGDFVQPGVEIPIQVTLADDERLESYGLYVDGALIERISPADVPSAEKTFLWTPPHDAAPGTAFAVRVEARDFAGNVGAATATMQVPTEAILTSDQVINQLEAGQDLVLGVGDFTLDETLGLASLRMLRGARLITRAGGFDLDVAGDVRVQCGASIDASGLGFEGGEGHLPGAAPTWVSPSDRDAGGSHGGAGRPHQMAGPAGDIYDSVYMPTMPGGGGGQLSNNPAGDGGGTLFLDAAHLVVHGAIRARGQDGPASGGGGGGTIVIGATSLTGDGTIDASGGDALFGTCCGFAGPGGGGRVALYVNDLSGFDVENHAFARGGAKLRNGLDPARYAAPGTLFLFDAGAVYGRLILSNGQEADGSPRAEGTAAELPALGGGAVSSFTPAGGDAWISTDRDLRPRWLGAWMTLLDGAGAVLGTFEVLELDGAQGALLQGAGSVSGAASLRGVYRFDDLRLVNTDLLMSDPLDVLTVELEGTGSLPEGYRPPSFILRSGSRLRPAGDSMTFTAGTVVVEEGAVIDVSERGYAAGPLGQPGGAPVGVEPSYTDAGGSHGGAGNTEVASGPAGEVFDSVYAPHLSGGGGTAHLAGGGGRGGGVLHLIVDSLVLDGELRARGEVGTHGYGTEGGSGAGGTIRVDAGVLSGSGLIDASGGDTPWSGFSGESGNAGGGRVALYVDDLSAFDPYIQVTVRAGQNIQGNGDKAPFASPGTIYVRAPGATYGRLIIDAEEDEAGQPHGSIPTPLPSLGASSVAGLDAIGADAWLDGGTPHLGRWLGTWVRLLDAAGGDLGLFEVLEIGADGRLRLAGASAVASAATYRGEYHFDHVELLHGAGLVSSDPLDGETLTFEGEGRVGGTVTAEQVTIKSGAVVRPAAGSTLRFDVPGKLTIEAGARLDVTGFGYAGGPASQPGSAPDWVDPSLPAAGGSHGGHGSIDYGDGPAGDIFDSLYLPTLPGGGGSGVGNGTPGAGGGVIELVAGEVELLGEIRARGGGGWAGGAGAGGTVLIDAGSLYGDGTIDASAGDTSWNGAIGETGNGGGGRVALWVDDLSLFDPKAQVTVRAGVNVSGNGNQPDHAAPGTLFLRDAQATYGSLVIDAQADDGGTAWPSIPTQLPTLGAGAVTQLAADGADAWVTAATPFRARWKGAYMALADAAGTVLGTYRISTLDGAGRARLEGAATELGGALQDAATWRGEYRFDAVQLLNGAGMTTADAVVGPAVIFEGDTQVSGVISATDVVVKSGATVRPASGESLRFEVSGKLTVEAGGLIDVTGLGYGPGVPGSAPEGIAASQPAAGGSHGGRGSVDYEDGPAGDIFDSVYRPTLSGGGGSRLSNNGGIAGAGGGILEIFAAEVELLGELRARGAGSSGGGAGAGGTVYIEAGRLFGGGSIDASAGDTAYNGGVGEAGNGGGGRVALWVDDLSAFDVVAQVTARAGLNVNGNGNQPDHAAPGTIFVRDAEATYGGLVIDAKADSEGTAWPSIPTELPALGTGAVTLAEVDGESAWISAAQAFRPRWRGAYMTLEDAAGTVLGTYRVGALDPSGRVRLDGAAAELGAALQGAVNWRGEYRFDSVELLRGAGMTTTDSVVGPAVVFEGDTQVSGVVSATEVVVKAGATVRPASGNGLRFEVAGTLTVEAGALIDVTGYGYAPGVPGGAPAGVAPSQPAAGGSHGGRGSVDYEDGPAGDIFDSVYRPTLSGGGGSRLSNNGGVAGAGGGVLEIFAGEVELLGELRARGAGSSGGGAGAGGTVYIEAGRLSGGGSIDASAGDTAYNGGVGEAGNGGGGRVALWVDDLTFFDAAAQVNVRAGVNTGGNGNQPDHAAPGTLFVRDAAATYGRLVVDAGVDASGDPWPRIATELPALGAGTVTAVEIAGADVWLTPAESLEPRWLRAYMKLEDAAGTSLGTFEVVEIEAGRARLAGAGAAAGTVSTYAGEYRFDRFELVNGAGVLAEDPIFAAAMEFQGAAVLSAETLRADSATVTAGSSLRPAAGKALRLDVSGQLTVEAGALIDVTGAGYAGAPTASVPGEAPAWVSPSYPAAGGSHGGVGSTDYGTGPAGEIYDSVYVPTLAGGGGAKVGTGTGGAGGGVLEIVAGSLLLDGELRARGGGGHAGGGGAGGTVRIDAATLSGVGSIDASGGDTSWNGGIGEAGNGGGGRVALWVDDVSGFDLTRITARAGVNTGGNGDQPPYAAPGTIYVTDAASTHGSLTIDVGLDGSGTPWNSTPTELPTLGTGAAAQVEAAGGDLWITADTTAFPDGFRPRWLGAFMVLMDGAGTELGVHRVLEIDASGRALLADVASAAAVATFRGEYRFDEVSLLHGADVRPVDPFSVADMTVSGPVVLDGTVHVGDLTLLDGAVVRPSVAGQDLHLVATGTITVASGALIDVSGLGHAGGLATSQPGDAPEGVDAAGKNVGGAHGGLGVNPYGSADAGEVYDSVYWPSLAGAGGGAEGGYVGTAGGGVLILEAPTVEIDGELRARGASSSGRRGTGAGGTLVVRADALTGAGILDVSGGDTTWNVSGYGGGGRIALHAADLSGFDPAGAVLRGGGNSNSQGEVSAPGAAPGTLYLLDAAGTWGDLVVDGGFSSASPITQLPSIGRGTVGMATPDGADLWIEPEDPAIRYGVGVTGMWVRVDGVLYSVLAERMDRRGLLLEGAAGTVAVGDRYVGFYRFDNVSVRGGARLRFADGGEVGAWDVETGSETITLDLTPPSLTVTSPADGALFASGDVFTVTATATDPSGVGAVTLLFDGQTLVDTEAPYEWTVTAPPTASSVTVPLTVEAEDLETNLGSVTHLLTIEGVPSGSAPVATLLCPGTGALLAPGTGLSVAVDATDDHEVARVEIYLGGELQATLHDPPYEAVATAPATSVDGDVLTLEARAFDFSGQSGSSTLPVTVVEGSVITGDTLLRADDLSLDGTSVVVASGSLTVDGDHSFRDLAVLSGARVTHLPALSPEGLVGDWSFDGADPAVGDVGPDLRLGSTAGADGNDPQTVCAGALAPLTGNVCGLELVGENVDATGDYLAVPAEGELQLTDAYTLAAWVRMDSGGQALYRPIFFRGADDGVTDVNDIEVYTDYSNRRITVLHNRNGGAWQDYVRFPAPPTDAFFHLAVTFDGTHLRAFYDGVEQARVERDAVMPKPQLSGHGWMFGKVNHSAFSRGARPNFLDGALDDIRLYGRALGATEVRALAGGGGGEAGLRLELTRDLYVACGASIDATGLGWASGVGALGALADGALGAAGGSHGGRGGLFDGTGRIYGNLFDPADPGAGGGAAGTAGGGVVRITANGQAVIDGVIEARGGGEGATVPHGAGGSVRLDADTVRGLGSLDASGAGSTSAAAGGGGGRVALYANAIDAGFLSRLRVTGGAATTAEATGAAGTLYLKRDTQALGELHVKDRGVISSQITELPSVGEGVIDSVDASGFVDFDADFTSSLVGHEVEVAGDAARRWTITDHADHGQRLDVDVVSLALDAVAGEAYRGLLRFDRVVIDGSSTVFSRDPVLAAEAPAVAANATWQVGYLPSVTLTAPTAGAVFDAGDPVTIEASVDDPLGMGEVVFTLVDREATVEAEPWTATFTAPPVTTLSTLTVRAEAFDLAGRRLVGEVAITVRPLTPVSAPVVQLTGCPNDFDLFPPGAEISLDWLASDDAAVESYRFLVDGLEQEGTVGLDVDTVSGSFPWTVPADAAAGQIFTLRLEAKDYAGSVGAVEVRVQVAPAGYLVGDQPIGAAQAGQSLVLAAGTYTLAEPVSLAGLTLLDGAVLTGPAQQTFDLTVGGELRIQCGARLDMAARGYAGGTQNDIPGHAPAGVPRAQRYGGGSHGGLGRDGYNANTLGAIYDSVYLPQEAGAGGARGDSWQYGGGGGGLMLVQAGSLVLDGEISSRGGDVSNSYAGAGAGGSVVISAASLAGTGVIDASGGDDIRTGGRFGGLGGGGRVALLVADLAGFDVVRQVRVEGGSRHETNGTIGLDATPGTVYVEHATSTHGDLVISAHADDRTVPATSLPDLGTGVVASAAAEGGDAWITAGAAFDIRWLGAHMRLGDAAGTDLGRFRVMDVDGAGRVRLEAAATVAASAASYAGEYVFDSITLRAGAGLDATDPVFGGVLELTDDARVPGFLVADQLTVASGATVSAASGRELDLAVTGTLTVAAGGALSMDARGYSGGTQNDIPGHSPAGIARAQRYGGGSHGGLGRDGYNPGTVGEVFGSVYEPHEAGAGGARGDSWQYGGNGGGLITVHAGAIVLEGEIRASGGDVSNSYGGAGAGGAVVLRTGSLSGTGEVHAQGGDDIRTGGRFGGLGGGGRVALVADVLDGFDPVSQVFVQGGSRLETNGTIGLDAAAGTLFVKRAADTWGELIVQGHAADRSLPITRLPELGSGAVTATEVDDGDLWITAGTAFMGRWLGVWVTLDDVAGQDLGSFRVAEVDGAGRLRLEAAQVASAAATYRGEYRFDRLEVVGGAGVDTGEPITALELELRDEARLPNVLEAANVTLRAGASVRPAVGGDLHLAVSGTFTVEAGATLHLRGLGYAGGTNADIPGQSPPGILRAQRYAGGSHGGLGRDGYNTGAVGEVYGSVYMPSLAGAGGALGDSWHYGGGGGGLLILEAGHVVVDGRIWASGADVSNSYGGSGAGGTVRITASSLAGSGTIEVAGGDDIRTGGRFGGLGGGGRVSLWVDDVSGFPLTQVRAEGGSRIETDGSITVDAAPGTLFVREAGATFGDLILDAHTDRVVPQTLLPDLVGGAVALAEAVDGADPASDVWITGAGSFASRWLGVWVRLTDAAGDDLGSFRAVEIDASGRLRLATAGPGVAAQAMGYAGEYRFDDVIVRGGAGLDVASPVAAASVSVAGDPVRVPSVLEVQDLVVTAGARLVPSRGQQLAITASGTVTVEAGAFIDVSSYGFRGGNNSLHHGDTVLGVKRADRYGGGGHGGDGADGYNSGSAGGAFDSVYAPSFPGGGGGLGDSWQYGGWGGGILRLEAQTLVLDGELLSRGGDVTGSYGGSGAGGTIALDVGEMRGAGLIDASGGDDIRTGGRWGGLGGGGRVWIDADLFTGFDPHAQVVMRGGIRYSTGGVPERQAGAGTLLLRQPGDTHGHLVIDQGPVYAGIGIEDTPLAVVGSGTVGTVETDASVASDLWLEDADVAALFSHGVTGAHLRISGVDYRILDFSEDLRRVLLEGASGVVTGGESYEGVYKFDSVTLRGRATLTYGDLDEVGVYTTDPESVLVRPSP